MCVSVRQLLKPDDESTSTQRYIDSRTVQPKAKGAWVSVDVTETVKDWLSDPGQLQHDISLNPPCKSAPSKSIYCHVLLPPSENNVGLKLGVHCPCCTFVPATNNIVPNKSEELEALFAGLLQVLVFVLHMIGVFSQILFRLRCSIFAKCHV